MEFIIVETMYINGAFVKSRAMILLADNFTDAKKKLKKSLGDKVKITADLENLFSYEMYRLTSKIVGTLDDTPPVILS